MVIGDWLLEKRKVRSKTGFGNAGVKRRLEIAAPWHLTTTADEGGRKGLEPSIDTNDY
jgi:hypothetical protein